MVGVTVIRELACRKTVASTATDRGPKVFQSTGSIGKFNGHYRYIFIKAFFRPIRSNTLL